jgi:hypothetical protein
MLFILLAAFSYYFFKDPDKMPEKVQESIEMMKSGVNDLEDKGKNLFTDSKDLYKKTKEAPKELNRLLKQSDKEVDKDFKK